MINLLKDWKGKITVNDADFNSVEDAISHFKTLEDNIHIVLHPAQENCVKQGILASEKTYRVTVKQYMLKKATPEFDFMLKWNNNIPMPLCTMIGTVEKETRGMVYMKLHGDIYAKRICTCMKCGRELTNPVSQYFGIGPECGGHNYTNPFSSDEELQNAVSEYKAKLRNMTWSGWIIKSAILNFEEYDDKQQEFN